jgi:hypothetical protein
MEDEAKAKRNLVQVETRQRYAVLFVREEFDRNIES